MKVLLYNWVAFDDVKERGGGVTVYLKNLVDTLVKEYKDVEVTFLSSGSYYDIYDKNVRYERVDNLYGEACASFAIINSPVFSPAYLSFPQVDTVLNDEKLKMVFSAFLKEQGPFDIVHFHNLEGLSVKVLQVKLQFPYTRFIYTIHNYYAFCPQVNLWRKENESCDKIDTDVNCIECMKYHVPFEKLRRKMAMTYSLVKCRNETLERAYVICGNKLDQIYRSEEFGTMPIESKKRVEVSLERYRTVFVECINNYMDKVLGVSNRVSEISVKMGIRKELIQTSYIGTKVAETIIEQRGHKNYENGIELIFMGYKRADKGYYFLMKVLQALDKDVAQRLSVTIAARKLPDYPDVHIDENRFKRYVTFDGYNREDIPRLLKGKHLGIIPVLWEDNLPQVAVEMVANGLAILTSDKGGASELGKNENFCFKAGDVQECAAKITYFVKNPETIEEYWVNFNGLTTMGKHIEELFKIYSEE